MIEPRDLRLVPLSVEAMRVLVEGDLGAASDALGIRATPYLADHAWLWEIRLAQVAEDPASLDWIARVAVRSDGAVVGVVGFHGPPDCARHGGGGVRRRPRVPPPGVRPGPARDGPGVGCAPRRR